MKLPSQRNKRKKEYLQDLIDTIKRNSICIIRIPGEEKEKGTDNIRNGHPDPGGPKNPK